MISLEFTDLERNICLIIREVHYLMANHSQTACCVNKKLFPDLNNTSFKSPSPKPALFCRVKQLGNGYDEYKGLFVCSLNIGSLLKHFDEMKVFLINKSPTYLA